MPEASFRCFPGDPERIRRPDVAFIASQNVPQNLEEPYITVAPDIAIEVVSPNDRIYELDEKLDDYCSAGVKLIWLISPHSRVLRVFRPGQMFLELLENDILHGDPVLSNFDIPVHRLLPPPLITKP